MKRIRIGVLLVAMLTMATLPGCGTKQEMKLVNEQSFNPSEVSSIRLDYDNDDITLLESATGAIILKEYMDIDKNAYYAHIENIDGALSISEGQRPGGNRLDCYVALYLPAGYEADLSVHTTESSLQTQVNHTLAALHAETTHGTLEITDISARTVSISSAAGTINMRNVTADIISIDVTNAKVEADTMEGEIKYTTSNGELILRGATGCGTFAATSNGKLNLAFEEITGDIKATAKNSDIHFTIPKGAAFHFIALSRGGSIDTSYDGVVVSGRQASGDVGTNPHFTIALETRNGNIEAR